MKEHDLCTRGTTNYGSDMSSSLVIGDRLRSSLCVVHVEPSKDVSERFLLVDIVKLYGLCCTTEGAPFVVCSVRPVDTCADLQVLASNDSWFFQVHCSRRHRRL